MARVMLGCNDPAKGADFPLGARMRNEQLDPLPDGSGKLSGQSARRKFLTTSGRIAIAAPAVVLLLSATSRNAQAQARPYNLDLDES